MTATLAHQLAGPLDIELQGRVAAAAAQARALLGDAAGTDAAAAPAAPAAPADALRDLIDALTARLSEQREDAPGAVVREQEAALRAAAPPLRHPLRGARRRAPGD